MSEIDIKEAVRERYAEIASNVSPDYARRVGGCSLNV
jgi:hypothetical protein